jgi:cyclase
MEVDEICVLDIDASIDRRCIDFDFVAEISSECFMPLSVGGGVASLDQARRIIDSGVEKIVVRTHATTEMVGAIAREYGNQAVIGCVDYVKSGSGYIELLRGSTLTSEAQRLASAGAGELIVQSVDRDGKRQGMDVDVIADVSKAVAIPVIAMGGANDMADLHTAIDAGAAAAASGSAFSFFGRLRAVLVNYPDYQSRLRDRCI